jgi:hypothetical protein
MAFRKSPVDQETKPSSTSSRTQHSLGGSKLVAIGKALVAVKTL